MKTKTIRVFNLRTGKQAFQIPADAVKQSNETTAAFYQRVKILGATS